MAAWASLKWIEGAETNSTASFYFAAGVFIYTFAVCLLIPLLAATTGDAVWWIHDAANITAYLIFYCFYLIKKIHNQVEKSVINLPEKSLLTQVLLPFSSVAKTK